MKKSVTLSLVIAAAMGLAACAEKAADDAAATATEATNAVEGAAEYWRTLGFAEEAVSGELGEKLATYGSRARWMTREIP